MSLRQLMILVYIVLRKVPHELDPTFGCMYFGLFR